MKIILNSTAKPLPIYRPIKNKYLGQIARLVRGDTRFICLACEATRTPHKQEWAIQAISGFAGKTEPGTSPFLPINCF